MDYYQIHFRNMSSDQNDMLIALLSENNFSGFEEEENELKAYIAESDFDEELFITLIENINTNYSKSIIKEINWNEKWESDFEPITILDPFTQLSFAKVRAAFHQDDTTVPNQIIVTPKMSFGTGHHATTYLMMERMSQINFINKAVIDFGTGTGVLAILAEKLGAKKITAIDNDDWSINNAKENIDANNCSKIILQKAENISPELKADIILANINLNVIISCLDAIVNACNNNAALLFSGVLLQDKEQLLNALMKKNIKVSGCFEKNNWICVSADYTFL